MANIDRFPPKAEKALAQLEQALAHATKVATDLRSTQEFALGTGDVVIDKVALTTKVEALLRQFPMTLSELAAELGAPAGQVNTVLRRLKQKTQVWNVGEEDRPRWRWVIGDDCSFPELCEEVHRLLRERPMSHVDLKAATGANPNRLKGAVTQLVRNGVDVRNVSGDPRKALWYVRGGAA